jgi:hypothetical protein
MYIRICACVGHRTIFFQLRCVIVYTELSLDTGIIIPNKSKLSIAMDARSKAGSAPVHLLGLWVRIPPGHVCVSLVSVVSSQVEVSASVLLLVQRSPTEFGASEYDRETSPQEGLAQ